MCVTIVYVGFVYAMQSINLHVLDLALLLTHLFPDSIFRQIL